MPNIIMELWRELERVQALLINLEDSGDHGAGLEARQARNLIRYGLSALNLNRYEDMREALDDLRDFGKPKPAEPEP